MASIEVLRNADSTSIIFNKKHQEFQKLRENAVEHSVM